MSNGSAGFDKAIVVAPQERPPRVKQYLAMLASMDPVLGTKTELDFDRLLELAQSRMGAVASGTASDLDFEGMRCLAKSIQQDPRYDEIGKRTASQYIHRWISKYIQFERDLIAYPDIPHVPVPKPMFLVGFGRTGSTFLHQLLALDPQMRAPRLWELTEPSPPPRSESYATDPRIRRVQMQLKSQSIAMPDLYKIHEADDAQAPEECHFMMRHGPHQITFGLRSPEYWQWLCDLSPSQLHALYEGYKLQVQHLQLFHRRGHWVSKSWTHAHFSAVLFKVFPDARLVRLHRDPCQIIPALASLIAHLQMPYLDRADFHELGQLMLAFFSESMSRTMRSDKEANPDQNIDVVFEDLIRNPIGVIREIYSKFGYDYTARFDDELTAYLQRGVTARQYKHVYSLEQFGLSRAQVIARSEEYLSWAEQRTGSRLLPA